MRRSVPGPSVLLLVLAVLAACSTDVPASNPFDPDAATLAPGALEGRVLLAAGTPAVGATILRARGGSATADADGRFRLEAPPTPAGEPGEVLTVSAELSGVTYGPVVVDGLRIPIGGVVEVPTITLSLAAGAVVGVVRAAGRPLEGAIVTVEGASASVRTLPDGRFELRGAPVGFRRVSARSDGHRFEPALVEVPAAGAATAELDGVRFGLEVTHLPAEGASAGATSSRELALRLVADDATTARASEDPDFVDAARGDLELRALAEPFAVTLPDGPDGLRTLRVQAANAAGDRTERIELPLLLDRVAPALPTTTLPITSGADELPLGLAAADASPSSGIAGLSLGIDGRAPERRSLESPLDVASLAEGLRLLTIAARDGAGNEGPAASLPLVVDRTAPELVGAASLDDGRPDPLPGAAREREVVLVLTALDDGRRALEAIACERCDARFEVEVGGGAEPARVTLAPTADDVLRVPVRLLAPSGGTGELTVTVRDPAGNATTTSVPYRLDDDPPRIRALAAPAYTNATSLRPSLEADADAIEVRALARPGAACSIAELEVVPFGPLPLDPVALGAEEGLHSLCVQVRDGAGNRSEVAAVSVVVDRTPPAPLPAAAFAALLRDGDPTPDAGAHVERGGAARAAGKTNEPIAAFWIGATDASPLLAQATVADEGVVASFAGLPSVPLLDGALQRSLVVLPPGDGVRELHARIVDAAGNELLLPTAGVARIELDRVPPEAPWVRPGTRLVDLPPSTFDVVDALASAPPVAATLGVSRLKFNDLDDGVGTRLELYAAFAAPTATAPVGLDAEFRWSDVTDRVVPCDATDGCLDVAIRQGTAALGARVTRFFLRAVDAAGNVSAEAPFELEEDSTPPQAPAGLELVPGDGTVLARWQPPAGDVAGYEIWFGARFPGVADPLTLAGVVAVEGPSPVTSFAPQQQLNGLPNGAAVSVAIRAFDRWALEHPDATGRFCPGVDGGIAPAAAHCSPFTPLETAWPGRVTPERLGEVALAGGARDVSLRDGWVWALGPAAGAGAALSAIDASRPLSPTLVSTLALPGEPGRLDRDGSLLCVALGSAGVALVSLAEPDSPLALAFVTSATNATDCSLAHGRLAIAWRGDVALDRCAPGRDGGVTVHDVADPSAPLLLERYDGADDALLSAVTSVRLWGDAVYAVADSTRGSCPGEVDGDLIRVPLGGGAITWQDVGEEAIGAGIAVDGRVIAAIRTGLIALSGPGPLDRAGHPAVATGAAAPQLVTLDDPGDLVFSGSHLYVADRAASHGTGSGFGALVVIDPRDGALVGRLDVAGAVGLDAEGPGLAIATATGVVLARAVSPTQARLVRTLNNANATIATHGPIALAAAGAFTPVYDLASGDLTRLDGFGAQAGADQQTDCASLSAILTADEVILGCHGGVLRRYRQEGGRLTPLGLLGGLPDAPTTLVRDGTTLWVAGHGAGETSLHAVRLEPAGGLTRLGGLALTVAAIGAPELALDGRRLWVGLQTEGLRLVDVSDPLAPTLLPLVGGPASAGGVAVQGRVLYTNSNTPGVNVTAWDSTDPSNLVELGRSSPVVAYGDVSCGPVRASLGVGAAAGFYADALLLDLTEPTAPRLAGGPIDQLRSEAVDLALTDTAILLANYENLSRIELD